MNQQELLMELHRYTEFELFCQKHNVALQTNLSLIELFKNTHPDYGKKQQGLHCFLYRENTDSSNTYMDGSSCPKRTFDSLENVPLDLEAPIFYNIRISQHDRYSPPVMHSHDYYELLYVFEGEITHQISLEKSILYTGDLCLIPPGVMHCLNVQNYSIVINISIQTDLFKHIFLNDLKTGNILSEFFLGSIYAENINNYIVFHTNGDRNLQEIILDMCLESINKDRYYEELLHTNLLRFFAYLLRYYEYNCEMPTIQRKKDIVNYAILKYIEQNYSTVTLAKLAEKFHYSPQQISIKLKTLTGLTFSGLILKRRMQMASFLLKETNLKIKEISENIGYQNPEHFIRTFSKYYQMTPNDYRKHTCSRKN